ncbi:alpha/beta hydrolase [Microbacterium sp.]|uniref:alpha/beta fold hydrolase n=1 Tax=Microbacterium sp. TaxID=51671 RepID=UPI003341D13A
MHIERSGSGTRVLLLHGAGVAGWMWRPVRELLGADGDPVETIVPDLPGHGRSSAEPYVSHSETLAALAPLLAEGPLHVVGFSLGAQLALELASRHPDLIRSATIVSGSTLPSKGEWIAAGVVRAAMPLARRMRFARRQAAEMSIPADLVDDFVRDSGTLGTESLVTAFRENMRFALPEGWARYPGPAHVMVGERELRAVHRSAAHTHAALPHSTLETVPACAHDVPFTRPDTVVRALRAGIVAA